MSRPSSSVKGLPFYLRERAGSLVHACPSCGAPAGHSCLSEQGKAVRNHAARPGAL